MTYSRVESVYLAKVAAQADLYDCAIFSSFLNMGLFSTNSFGCMNIVMVENMQHVASFGDDLNYEERNLLAIAYNNTVGARRASWRIVSSIERRAKLGSCPEVSG